MNHPPVTLSGHVHENHGVTISRNIGKGDTRFAVLNGEIQWEVHTGIKWEPFWLPLPEMPKLPALSRSRRSDLIRAYIAYYTMLFADTRQPALVAEYEPEIEAYSAARINQPEADKLQRFVAELLEPV